MQAIYDRMVVTQHQFGSALTAEDTALLEVFDVSKMQDFKQAQHAVINMNTADNVNDVSVNFWLIANIDKTNNIVKLESRPSDVPRHNYTYEELLNVPETWKNANTATKDLVGQSLGFEDAERDVYLDEGMYDYNTAF